MISALEDRVVPHTDEPVLDHLSPSSISSFLTCSLRWKFERIDHLPSKASQALRLGKAVHRAIEVYNLQAFRGISSDKKVVIEAFDEELLSTDESPLELSKAELEKLKSKGHAMVRAYLQSSASEHKLKKVGVEVSMDDAGKHLPVRLIGIADLIESDDGRLVVTDYKTTSTQPSASESFKHLFQMSAYALMVEEMSNLPVKGIRFVWITKHTEPRVVEQTLARPSNQQIHRFLKAAEHAYDGILNERYVPQPSPMVCATCSFKGNCMAWPQVEGGTV